MPQPPTDANGNQMAPPQGGNGGHKPQGGKPGNGSNQKPSQEGQYNAQQSQSVQTLNNNSTSDNSSSKNQVSTLFKVLIVLIPTIGPIAGVVLYFLNKSKNPNVANTYFKFAMIGIAVQLIFYGGSRM